MPPVCVLLTDFPLLDPYVGAMKGAVLQRSPTARLVDLAHGLPAGDVAWAALQLAAHRAHFPEDAVFLAVVDPGVGTGRRILAAECGGQRFVGPDNGLLFPALGREATVCAVDVDRVRVNRGSETFHGRDVMAPVAASLLDGARPESLGSRIDDPVALELPVAHARGNGWDGVVLHVDGYGNLITSVAVADCPEPSRWRVWVDGRDVGSIRRCYADVASGEPVAVVGSIDRIEVSVRDGDAGATFGVGRGAVVRVERIR